jgi:DUF4097 and DUF4098 domain-containing protein YvlB
MTLPAARRLRRHLAALAVLAAFPAASWAGSVTETIDRTLPLPSGGEVVVQNFNGHVEVAGGDGGQVRLVAVKSARAATDGRARSYLRDLQVKIEERDGRLVIRTIAPGGEGGIKGWLACAGVDGNVSYRLLVPRTARVAATTVNGNVEVARLHAPVRAASTNGSVNVLEVGGEVDATSVNGNIRVDMRQAEPRSQMDLSTVNGSIVLYLPAEFRAYVDARTVNGSVASDLPLTVEGRRSRSRLVGSLNGGQTKLVLRTTNGSILLRQP